MNFLNSLNYLVFFLGSVLFLLAIDLMTAKPSIEVDGDTAEPEELDANGFPDDFPNGEDFDSMFPKSRFLGDA